MDLIELFQCEFLLGQCRAQKIQSDRVYHKRVNDLRNGQQKRYKHHSVLDYTHNRFSKERRSAFRKTASYHTHHGTTDDIAPIVVNKVGKTWYDCRPYKRSISHFVS